MERNDHILPLTPLPTSLSYIHTPSLPTTPSLLSRHPSRTLLTNLPSSKSHPALPSSTISSPANQPHPRLQHRQNRQRRPLTQVPNGDDDWLTRTASALTLSRLEEKGQSWLVARESSTSLTSPLVDEAEGAQSIVEGDRGRSRYTSAHSSFTRIGEKRSRRGSAAEKGIGVMSEGVRHRGKGRNGGEGEGGGGGGEWKREMGFEGPDFVNENDLREALGELEVEEGEEVDEGEMKNVVMGKIGGWVDWAVGWMDVREDAEGEEEEDFVEGYGKEQGLNVEEVRRRLDAQGAKSGDESELAIGPPPVDGGWVGDAKWLFGVAKRIAL